MTLDKDWEYLILKDICEKIMVGIASSATHAYRDEGVILLRNQNIKENKIDTSDLLHIDPEYELKHRRKRLKTGDILTVRTGYPGLSAVVPEQFDGAQCFTSLISRPKNNIIDSHFLCYYINSDSGKRFINSREAGGAQKNVNASVLSKMKVPVPPLNKQKKIVEILGTWDEALAQTERLIALEEQRKKGLMQRLFLQEVRFRQDDGTAFPDWQKGKLSQLLYQHKKRNRDLQFSKEGVLSVSGDVGIVNQIEYMGRSYAGKSVANYHVVHHQDVVYTKSPLKANPYGIIKSNRGKPGIVSTLYAVYTCTKYADSRYIEHYFSLDDNVNRYLRPLVRKGAKNDMKINNEHVLSGSFDYPSLQEQRKIADFLDTCDEKITLLQQKLAALQQQKKGLMQRLLTGQLRVGHKIESSLIPSPQPIENFSHTQAVLLWLAFAFAAHHNPPTKIQMQKLAYLAQAEGEPLNLEFVKHLYGPYSQALATLLEEMVKAQHLTSQSKSRKTLFTPTPEIEQNVKQYMAQHPDSLKRLQMVMELIKGFEKSSRMGILASVHLLAQENPAFNIDSLIEAFHNWNSLKSNVKPTQIRKALSRLEQFGLVGQQKTASKNEHFVESHV